MGRDVGDDTGGLFLCILPRILAMMEMRSRLMDGMTWAC